MEKHKPATPLPWHGVKFAHEDDYAYSVHAANAYPRSIETFSTLVERLERQAGHLDKTDAHQASVSRSMAAKVRALLRELGEE